MLCLYLVCFVCYRKLIEERERNVLAYKSREGVRTAEGDFDRFWSLAEVKTKT
jgi:hypothetical protein